MDAATIGVAHHIGDRALAWLDGVRSLFALDRDIPHHQIDGGALKSLAELALAAELVLREAVAGPRGASLAEGLFDFVWRQFDDGELLYQLQRHTPAATYPLELYSTFAAAGYRHPALERLLTHLIALRASRFPEQVPNRRLAVLAAARRTGLPIHDDPAELTALTWLGGMPEPWMLDASNGYGVTHTVFHLTDWGAEPGGLPEELEDYLHRWLPVWVEVYTESAGWDLLGEFLMVGACLRRPLFYPYAWQQLANAQHEDGMLPNGLTRPSTDPRQVFTNHHHPTIVAVAAASLTVSRGLTSAATTPASS